MKLKVEQADWREVFTDTVRIAKYSRKTESGGDIESGSLVRIDYRKNYVLAIARGVPERDSDGVICIDEILRAKLSGIKPGDVIEVTLRVASLWDQLTWYRKASNPAVRIPAWVALISSGLGFISVGLGILSVAISCL